MTTAPKLEPWPYPGFTLDQIDEAVLSNDNISVALSEAILEATKRARAAPSAGLREALPFDETDLSQLRQVREELRNRWRASAFRLLDATISDIENRAALTLSKERWGVASPHQTIARDE